MYDIFAEIESTENVKKTMESLRYFLMNVLQYVRGRKSILDKQFASLECLCIRTGLFWSVGKEGGDEAGVFAANLTTTDSPNT